MSESQYPLVGIFWVKMGNYQNSLVQKAHIVKLHWAAALKAKSLMLIHHIFNPRRAE